MLRASALRSPVHGQPQAKAEHVAHGSGDGYETATGTTTGHSGEMLDRDLDDPEAEPVCLEEDLGIEHRRARPDRGDAVPDGAGEGLQATVEVALANAECHAHDEVVDATHE